MGKKVVFAVGGTGGHLFPAQALALDLKKEGYDVLFVGGRLQTNPFFKHSQFLCKEVKGESPFRKHPLFASFQLLQGIYESIKILKEFTPKYIVGFGSFYSFPILVAARLRKIPYVLVESNVHPGRVTRFFSSKAIFCAVQFEEALRLLKGTTIPTKLPLWSKKNTSDRCDPKEARRYFHLDPDIFTLLIFGGSQGASVLNTVAFLLHKEDLQVIHLCGKEQNEENILTIYKEKGIKACVKKFEEHMHLALCAADMALTRAGAGTLNELLEFSLPAIIVPWTQSSENHQYKNAEIFAKKGGGILLEEKNISSFPAHLEKARENLERLRFHLEQQRQRQTHIKKLSELLCEHF